MGGALKALCFPGFVAAECLTEEEGRVSRCPLFCEAGSLTVNSVLAATRGEGPTPVRVVDEDEEPAGLRGLL